MRSTPAGDNRVRLLAPLGHGGMSDVWLGALRGPAGFEKLVAVKQLRFVPNDRYDGGAAFLREARLAALLNHPNIVHTFEVVAQGGDYRIVMEFLEGQPLNRILKRAGASVPLREWIRVTSDLLAGLHYAHELTDLDGRPLGVVHRDVSPHNVFVDWEGNVKLLDFGIAAFGAPDPSEEGLLKGKLAYMAPEQARGDVVDRRSDVFAVGVVLFELLSGAPMWADRSDRGVYAEVIAGLLPDIHQRAPSAPEGLREICEIALARDPAERFASAAAMRQALDEWLDETGGRPNPRALGERVSELFAADRERIKALIAQGRATDDPTDDTDLNGPTPMPRGRSRATPRPALVSTATPMPTRPPTSMRWVVPVGGALGALAAGSLAAIGIVAVAAGWWLWGRPPVVPIDGACPATGRPVVELSGQIDADATLPCTRDYRLVGVVRVEEGATLTIAPGTVIRGAPGSVLAVSRGGRIVADGTAEAPIVLTSAAPNPRPGDWGGLVVLGRAPTNQPDLRFKGLVPEGDPVGGDDPTDDSGVLRYLRIAYAGYVVAPNNETNGVTFAGVGSGTVVDHVEVRSGADDCFEWFGGTVDASNLVCIDPGDDGYDIEWGYVGTLSSIVVVDRADGSPEHHGIEVDNDATAFAAEPRSAPTVRGATLCGPGSAGGGYGLVVRRGALGTYADLWVDGFAAAFDLRDGGGAPAVSAVVVAPGVPLGPREDQPVDARSAAADDDGGFDEAAGISAGAAGPACPVPPVGPVGALRPTDRWDAGWVHWD